MSTTEATATLPTARQEDEPVVPDLAQLPPGPTARRLLTVGRFMLQPTDFLESARDRYGDFFTLRLSPDRTVVVTSDPATVKDVIQADPALVWAGKGNEVLRPLLGARSVLLLDGAEHLRQRKLLLPPFHGERMRAYAETMREVAERHVGKWPRGRPFAVQPSMQAITLEVILRTVLGLDERERLEQVAAPIKRLLDATTSQARLLLLQLTSSKNPSAHSPWGRFNRLVRAADEVIREEFRLRRAAGDADERDDVLSLLIAARDEDGRALSDDELRDEVMTLLLAGHETTATALSWTMERLVRSPDTLGRLSADTVEADDEYLDAVIKETLRLRPVVPAVARYLTVPMALGGRSYPAGIHLMPSIYLLHRRADLYPDPEAFRPERFLGRQPGTYEWIPFGGGTRRCLGASFALFEMKVVLSTILRSGGLVPSLADDEPTRRRAITFAPARGGSITVRPSAETLRTRPFT